MHQRRGRGIWPVAHLFCGALDLPAARLADARVIAQRERDGRLAEPERAGDILLRNRGGRFFRVHWEAAIPSQKQEGASNSMRSTATALISQANHCRLARVATRLGQDPRRLGQAFHSLPRGEQKTKARNPKSWQKTFSCMRKPRFSRAKGMAIPVASKKYLPPL